MKNTAITLKSPAQRVFECKDLRRMIREFVNPYWVNPFFPSVEGALLEGRPELLKKGYKFISREQIGYFLSHFSLQYPLYASDCDFYNILKVIRSKESEPLPLYVGRNNSHSYTERYMHVFSIFEAGYYELLRQLVKSGDVERTCDLMGSLTKTSDKISWLYKAWRDETDRESMALLCMPYMRFLEDASNEIRGFDLAEFYHTEFCSIHRHMNQIGVRKSIIEDFKDAHAKYIGAIFERVVDLPFVRGVRWLNRE